MKIISVYNFGMTPVYISTYQDSDVNSMLVLHPSETFIFDVSDDMRIYAKSDTGEIPFLNIMEQYDNGNITRYRYRELSPPPVEIKKPRGYALPDWL